MKLSILVTFYNQKEYVDEALTSLLKANLPFEHEILIGDDGSRDGTLEKIKAWEAKLPGVVHSYVMPRDEGSSTPSIERAALNRVNLLRHAKGEYVAFLDGDDFCCDPEKFVAQIAVLDARKDLAASASDCFLYWAENNKRRMGQDKGKDAFFSNEDYWKYKYFHISTFVFRNAFLEKPIDFDPKFFDDNYIVFAFIKYGGVHYLNRPTTCYRQTEGSAWNDREIIERSICNLIDREAELRYNPGLRKAIEYRHLPEVWALKRAKLDESKIPERAKKQLEATGIDVFETIEEFGRFVGARMLLRKIGNKLRRR